MTALVTCGHTRAGLAAIRALGRAGVAVAAAAPARPAMGLWSRHATTTLLLPDAGSHARPFAQAVADEVTARGATAVFCATDAALWALSRWREALPASAQSILSPHDVVVFAQDRTALHDRARGLGIPHMRTWRIDRHDALEPTLRQLQKEHADDLRLTALVRPLVPWEERADGTRRVAATVPVQGIGALRRLLYARDDLVDGGCLVELRPEGQWLGYGGIARDGVVLAEIFQERLRERGDLSGVSTFARTTQPDAALRAVGQDVAAAFGLQGPFLVECYRGDDGVLRLVNLLPRLWGSVALAIRAGVNVPLLAWRLARGDDVAPGAVAEAGHTWRWVVGDAEVLLQRFSRLWAPLEGRMALARRASLVRALWESRTAWGAAPDVFEADDPLPSLLELSHRVDEVRRTRSATRALLP